MTLARMTVLLLGWGVSSLLNGPATVSTQSPSGCFRRAASTFPDSFALFMILTDHPDSTFRYPHAKSVEAFSDTGGHSRWPSESRFHGRWISLATDSVQVWWSDEFSGVLFRAQVSRDSLIGNANEFSDRIVIGEAPPIYRTTFVRVRCS